MASIFDFFRKKVKAEDVLKAVETLRDETRKAVLAVAQAIQALDRNHQEQHREIMQAITDYGDRQKAHNDRQNAALAVITGALTGVAGDIAELKKLIEQLQNSPGTLSPEDQATLDAAQARSESATTRLEAAAATLQAIDEQTPPPPPTT